MSIFDYKAFLTPGNEIGLDRFKDKVVLIVNTASDCGFTPQYSELQELYLKYKDQGLEILAFPCNQFGGQESGDDESIRKFCDLKYKITFPVFTKIEVNGENAHPLYNYLKEAKPGLMGSKNIKWNFTKFLVDRNGEPVERFAPSTKPFAIEHQIKKLL